MGDDTQEKKTFLENWRDFLLIIVGGLLATFGGLVSGYVSSLAAAERQEDEQDDRRFYEQMKVMDECSDIYSQNLYSARQLIAAIEDGEETESYEQFYLEDRKVWEEKHPGFYAKFVGFFGSEVIISYRDAAKAMDALNNALMKGVNGSNFEITVLERLEEEAHLKIVEHSSICISVAQK